MIEFEVLFYKTCRCTRGKFTEKITMIASKTAETFKLWKKKEGNEL